MQGQYWVVRTEEQKAHMFGELANIQPNKEKPMAVQVQQFKPKRTDLQNRFLNGWIYKNIAQQLEDAGIVISCDDGTEIPYTRDVLHKWVFGKKFRVIREYQIKGRTFYEFESTATMNRARFSEYVEQVRGFVYQYWNITIPDPVSGYFKTLMEELR
ncbi:recombination protein NinB [Microbulbifer sp. VTAC004]|uniref:recombination protein NinB n=1 Tax=unclassified Microbulbifer TaxID=2619833 RepID=UPI00403962D8